MTASGATKPTIMPLYHDPELVRVSPSLPRIHDLTLAGRSRPVTPYYVMKVGHTPLVPYHRPGDARVGDLVSQAIAAASTMGAPIHAVTLQPELSAALVGV